MAFILYTRLMATIASSLLFFLMLSKAKDKTKRLFALGILFAAIWNLLELLMTITGDQLTARLLLNAVLLCVVGAAASMSLFSVSLTYGKLSSMGMAISLVPALTIPLIIAFPQDVVPVAGEGFSSSYDPGFILLFGGLNGVPVVYALYNLVTLFMKLSGKLRTQMVLFIAGLMTMLLSAEIIDVFLHTLYGIPALGSIGVFIGSLIMIIPFVER